jgi:hypothetical protein
LESSGQRHGTFDIFSKHGFSSKKNWFDDPTAHDPSPPTKVILVKKNFDDQKFLLVGLVGNFTAGNFFCQFDFQNADHQVTGCWGGLKTKRTTRVGSE